MAAPVNNQYAIGNEGGRPALFETAQDMLDKANEYVEKCMEGDKCKVTISGMAYHLGFASRQSMYDYEERGDEFSYAIKRLRLFVESCYEAALYSQSPTGGIFALKNMGWKDKQEIDGSFNHKKTVDLENVTDDELRVIETLLTKLNAGASQGSEV